MTTKPFPINQLSVVVMTINRLPRLVHTYIHGHARTYTHTLIILIFDVKGDHCVNCYVNQH